MSNINENINIFVAFFNDESATTDKYVLETAFAIPPELSMSVPEGLLSGNIEIEGTAVSEKSEIENRLKNYKYPEPRYKSGVLNKYSKLVTGADRGAVTG